MMQQFYPSTAHSYRFELNKDMNFSAAHYIPAEEAGQCARMHGHTYHLNLTIAGDQLNDTGFLIDFKKLKNLIHKRYDHSVLNDHAEFAETFPTTEQLAQQIHLMTQALLDEAGNLAKCIQVIVRETPTSYVVYRPESEAVL